MTAPTTAGPAAPVAPTSPADTAGASITRLVRAELLKIWTTNSWWIFGIILLVTTGLTLIANLFQAHQDIEQLTQLSQAGPPDLTGVAPDQVALAQQAYQQATDATRVLNINAANVFTSGQYFGLLFVIILGALIVTNEFFHQTATTTFLVTPHRSRVIAGKLIAGAALAFGFWLVTTVIDLIVGLIFFSDSGHPAPIGHWPVLRSIVFNLLAYVIWAVLGIGLGVLIRSQLGATLTSAVAYLLGLPVALVFFALVNRYIITDQSVWNGIVAVPGVASEIMVAADQVQLGPILGPPWWVGLLVLLAYGAVAAAVGTVLTRRRDIS